MKAVVWSDTVQIFLMVASVVALVIKGVIDIGIENVWELNLNSSRIEFFKLENLFFHYFTRKNKLTYMLFLIALILILEHRKRYFFQHYTSTVEQ